MDEIQLILVDLDNVRGPRAGSLEASWASNLLLPPEADNGSPPCVVAFAMNLDTADHHVSFEGLRGLAQHLAAAIARSTLHGIEIALTLVVKESADLALERLLVHAPTVAHNGRLAAVHLVSDDLGLRENIQKYLGRNYASERITGGVSWAFAGKKKPTSRKAPKSGVHSIAALAPAHPHIEVCTPTLIAQLGQRPVDVPSGSALHEVSASVSSRPGLLTQLGITTLTLRGVERMGQLADGLHPVLSPLGPTDGLEICADNPPSGTYAEPTASALGPGAIRFESPPGTFTTQLPAGLVLAARGSLPAGTGRLDDSAVLKLIDDHALRRTETVKVRFSTQGRTLQAEAQRGFRQPLACWWRTPGKTESKPRLAHSPLSLKNGFSVDARCAIDHANGAVILQAPFDGSVWATVKHTSEDLVPGTVDGVPVACLLRPQTPAGQVRLTPIQKISAALFQKRFPRHHLHFQHLRRLPLLVPA